MLQVNPKLENYLLQHIDPETELLQELNRNTYVRMLYPRMLSGHLQGRILSMLSKMIRPVNILEIGTYTGYSAICLCEGLQPGGKLHTIELNDELVDFTTQYFEKAGLMDTIELHIGYALDVIPTLTGAFDIVFIDADKRQYLNYYHLVFDKVKTGGYIFADNVFWDGKIIENPLPTDDYTRGIIAFNDFVMNDPRVEKVILPIRDGFTVIRKK